MTKIQSSTPVRICQKKVISESQNDLPSKIRHVRQRLNADVVMKHRDAGTQTTGMGVVFPAKLMVDGEFVCE